MAIVKIRLLNAYAKTKIVGKEHIAMNVSIRFTLKRILKPLFAIAVCKDGCIHGTCQSPGECSCEVGWTGNHCDQCIPMAGCQNGGCDGSPLACKCQDGWMGPFCDCPKCKEGCNMEHGYCTQPGQCHCAPGWSGPNCDTCIKHPGCPESGTCTEAWDCFCEIEADDYHCAIKDLSREYDCFKNSYMNESCYHYNTSKFSKK